MLCLMDIYSAGEDAIPEVTSHRLYEAILQRGHLNVRYIGGVNGAARKLADMTMPGDVVLTLGAGDIYALGDQLLAELGVERKAHEQA
jgi:UDP-N-acetylmuramate--alanine ligase